jgi:lauroyl/myristoyl acyltransferase
MSQDHHPEQRARLTPLQRFLSHHLVTGAGMFVSKHAPPLIGHAVADLISGLVNWLKPDVYWILHANLRQVMGPEVEEKELHRLVRQVFHNNAGAIIVGTHTGNFDLGILALAAHGKDVQILGLAAPPAGGFNLMDQLRERTGAHLTPTSPQSLREAIKRLRAGGIVLTGVDRPVGDEEAAVEFFGRPALLPTGHVRLALKTDAAILVAGPYCDRPGHTVVRISPPLEMVRTGDRDEDLQVNLRRVTGWFMPVWQQHS